MNNIHVSPARSTGSREKPRFSINFRFCFSCTSFCSCSLRCSARISFAGTLRCGWRASRSRSCAASYTSCTDGHRYQLAEENDVLASNNIYTEGDLSVHIPHIDALYTLVQNDVGWNYVSVAEHLGARARTELVEGAQNANKLAAIAQRDEELL